MQNASRLRKTSAGGDMRRKRGEGRRTRGEGERKKKSRRDLKNSESERKSEGLGLNRGDQAKALVKDSCLRMRGGSCSKRSTRNRARARGRRASSSNSISSSRANPRGKGIRQGREEEGGMMARMRRMALLSLTRHTESGMRCQTCRLHGLPCPTPIATGSIIGTSTRMRPHGHHRYSSPPALNVRRRSRNRTSLCMASSSSSRRDGDSSSSSSSLSSKVQTVERACGLARSLASCQGRVCPTLRPCLATQ
mmetsp:Transcript_116127/g.323443  ORF Transcript_116127/g.323443 Transcript_116127/m.323443 type:complete len:251 (+) Transcript_116127:1510-2262(+)